VRISNISGIMSTGICDKSISAPIDIKKIAANISLNGIVITLATLALFDSATNTPANCWMDDHQAIVMEQITDAAYMINKNSYHQDIKFNSRPVA
jgi:hypothetical protein